MSAAEQIVIHGIGAVSPAGWGILPMREALAKGEPLPARELARPGWARPLRVRTVLPASARPAGASHPRLRRVSPITHYAVAAALEALGYPAVTTGRPESSRTGLIFCVMTGCVNYSRRFYDETLRDPMTASPLVFPETVFNAPASHIAAILGTTAISYTLVGDPGTFLQGLALAADWLLSERLDGCLVIGAEEIDWLTADAYGLFARNIVLSEGAGALHLRRERSNGAAARLRSITGAHSFCDTFTRARATQRMRAELPPGNPEHLLCDGTQNLRNVDTAEVEAWRDWPGSCLSPKTVLGEGLAAGSAWQCVAAVDALRQRQHPAASVSVVGCNQQSIGAHFVASHPASQKSDRPA